MDTLSSDTERDAFLANECIAFLRAHDKGRLVHQLENDLRTLVAAVLKHGKKGVLKLTLTITPECDEEGEIEQVLVKPDVQLTQPRAGSPKKAYFPTKTNGLSRHHPNQLSLDFEA